MKKKIILFTLVCCLWIGLFYAGVSSHENVHKTIYNYYNIPAETHVKMLGLGGGYTIAENDSLCNDICQHAHAMNEVITYNLGILSVLLLAIFSVMILRIE